MSKACLAVVGALGLVLASGCSGGEPVGDRPARPVFCYRSVERTSPGLLVAKDPIPCSSGGERWRAEGRRDRPDDLALLGSDGQVRMSYRLGHRPDGSVGWEERRYRQRPDGASIYELGQRYEFRAGPEGHWQEVLIRTELDDAGRPVQVEKRVGGRLDFRVVRTYAADGLQVEATYDAGGDLRLKSRFFDEQGKRYEEMVDGAGKLLLRREAVPDREQKKGRVLGDRADGKPAGQSP